MPTTNTTHDTFDNVYTHPASPQLQLHFISYDPPRSHTRSGASLRHIQEKVPAKTLFKPNLLPLDGSVASRDQSTPSLFRYNMPDIRYSIRLQYSVSHLGSSPPPSNDILRKLCLPAPISIFSIRRYPSRAGSATWRGARSRSTQAPGQPKVAELGEKK